MNMSIAKRLPHVGRLSLTDIVQAFHVARQRRRLAQLDDKALEDIGVSRRDAELEASRPIWDVPQHWRR